MKKTILFLTLSVLLTIQLEAAATSASRSLTCIGIYKDTPSAEQGLNGPSFDYKMLNYALDKPKLIETFCKLTLVAFKERLRAIVLVPAFLIENGFIERPRAFIENNLIIRNPESLALAMSSQKNCDVYFVHIYLSARNEEDVAIFLEDLSFLFECALVIDEDLR